MSNKKQVDLDSRPPNYSKEKHASNAFSHKPSVAQIGAYLVILS